MAKLISYPFIGCIILIQFIASFGFSTSQNSLNKISTAITTKALFIFGDSTVDPGNNNYIDTTPENRANYKPYGQNGFFKEESTGRFSDGRVIVDFIGEYAKLPLLPPFLQPGADYSYGANFASGGAGVLPQTNQGVVIDLPKQIRHFEEVRKSLVEKLGEEKAKELISESIYFISIGSNDYMGGYLGNPKMQQSYNPGQYVGMVIGNLTEAIQVLYEKGARKFGFLSLGPLGCLPALRALNNDETKKGGCLEAASAIALAHNIALTSVLTTLHQILQGFKYSNSNFYDWLQDRVDNPTNYGFKDGINACCGSGAYGGEFTCGTDKVKEYELCKNVGDYVWWDSFHPTEKIHEQFSKALWNGASSLVGPYNLEALFNNNEIDLTIESLVDDQENTIQQGQFH